MVLDPWGPILGVLFEDGSSDYILGVLQRAGIPTVFDLAEQEDYSHSTRKRAYKSRLNPIYSQLDPVARHCVARNIACEVAKSERGLAHINETLSRIGWIFQKGEL